MRGISTKAALLREGLTEAEIRRLVRRGELHRLRPGWFAEASAPPEAVRAVRAGGSLTCVSALGDYWVPPTPGLHVRLPANSRRATSTRGQLVPHRLLRAVGTPRRAVDPVPVALVAALDCLSAADWVSVVDSVLHRDHEPDELFATMLEVGCASPARLRELMARTSTRSESGSESLLRHDLVRANVRVRTQVWIGRDRVDLLVGDRLIIEVDSVAHHTGSERYVADRVRDQRLMAQGYQILRVTYHQVVRDRPRLVALVLHLCAGGVHEFGHVHRPMAAL